MANNTAPSIEKAPRWAWKVLIAICALIALAGAWMSRPPSDATATQANQTAYPLCADTQQGVVLTLVRPTAQLQLQSNCWSGWVSLPNHVNFRVKNPGQLQYRFWDGSLSPLVPADGTLWMGDIKHANFRLRGDGVADISVAPKR